MGFGFHRHQRSLRRYLQNHQSHLRQNHQSRLLRHQSRLEHLQRRIDHKQHAFVNHLRFRKLLEHPYTFAPLSFFIDIWMIFLRHFSISFFDIVLRSVLRNPQTIVIFCIVHNVRYQAVKRLNEK